MHQTSVTAALVPFKLPSNTGRQVNLDSFQRQAKGATVGLGTRDKGTGKEKKKKKRKTTQ